MRLSRHALTMLAAAALASAGETVPAELLPPGSRVVIGISVRSLLNSPLVKSLGGDAAKLTATITNAGPLVGLNPAKDIDSIIFASTGEGQTMAGLLVLRGRFQQAAVTKGGRLYHGVPIFEGGRGSQGALALLDDATAIAGTLADVRSAIDRRGGGSQIAPELARRMGALAEGHEFWAVGDLPEGFHSNNAATSDLNSVDHFQFGASLRDGLQLNGEIHLRSPEKAAQMAMSIALIESMLKAQQPAAGGSRFDLRSDNGTLKLDVFIPEAELRNGIAAQKDRLTGLILSQMGQLGQTGQMAQTGRLSPAPTAPTVSSSVIPMSHPAATPAVVVTNERGETVQVTLPGGK